jgi:hypothetical protein
MRRCNRTITVLAGLALAAATTRASDEVTTTVPYPEGVSGLATREVHADRAGSPAVAFGGANAKAACFDCHASQSARDYVFSALRP